jgi:hypothetical protein
MGFNSGFKGLSYIAKEKLNREMSNEMKGIRICFNVIFCVDGNEPPGSVTIIP